MKKIISALAMLLAVALLFTACSSKKEEESGKIASVKAPKTSQEEVSANIGVSDIEIILKKQSFSVEGLWFSYSEFKNSNKLSVSLGEKELDVYVKGGVFDYCDISEKDSVGNHISTVSYGKDGKQTAVAKNEYDEYGNCSLSANYDSSGALVSINVYKYNKTADLTAVYLYGANRKLKNITEYAYNDNGKLSKKYLYSADGKLVSRSEYSYSGKIRTEHMYDASGKSTGTIKS